jgi:hypothetical protein
VGPAITLLQFFNKHCISVDCFILITFNAHKFFNSQFAYCHLHCSYGSPVLKQFDLNNFMVEETICKIKSIGI